MRVSLVSLPQIVCLRDVVNCSNTFRFTSEKIENILNQPCTVHFPKWNDDQFYGVISNYWPFIWPISIQTWMTGVFDRERGVYSFVHYHHKCLETVEIQWNVWKYFYNFKRERRNWLRRDRLLEIPITIFIFSVNLPIFRRSLMLATLVIFGPLLDEDAEFISKDSQSIWRFLGTACIFSTVVTWGPSITAVQWQRIVFRTV